MSIDVAGILAADKEKKQDTSNLGPAPDPVVEQQAALDHHRRLWPMNAKVAEDKIPEVEGSDRVRFRRAAAVLAECGVRMGGSFAQSSVVDPHLSIRCGFDASGNFWSATGKIRELGDFSQEELLEIVQKTLQDWGFRAVVSLEGDILFPEDSSERSVCYAEAGVTRRRYSSASSIDPARILQFQRKLGAKLGSYGVSDWANSSFSADQAWDWCDAGIRTCREALDWQGLGLSARESGEWVACGAPAREAKIWMDAGYNAIKAKPWQVITSDAVVALEWIKAGFSESDTEMWVRFCGNSIRSPRPSDVALLVDAKVDRAQVARLREAGCDGGLIAPLAKWVARYKITLAEALEWAELGPEFVGPGKRGRWNKAGFTPADVRTWQQALGRRKIDIDEVRGKMEAGFDPASGAKWLAVHPRFANAEMISAWTDAGLAPEDAKRWVMLGDVFCRYSVAQGWIEAGLGIADAKRWVAASPSFARYSQVQAWQRACPDLASNPKALAELEQFTNPDSMRGILEVLERHSDRPGS